MVQFQNLSLRCIKGQPINDVVCRSLTEMGFPVDAPKQNPNISLEYDRYFWKISDSDFSVCGRVETEYIERLLETKSREKSFDTVLALLAEYGVTRSELTAALTSGCVFFFSPEEAQTMLDEFIFIIRSLLPRQLSDIYYSFDIEPNPAHGVFFDMAAKRLKLARYTDRNKNNYGQFISHTAEGVVEIFRDIERPYCEADGEPDRAGDYGHIPVKELYQDLIEATTEGSYSYDLGVYPLCCSGCGEPGCWSVTFHVREDDNYVWWYGFEHEHTDWKYDLEFMFLKDEYNKALNKLFQWVK